jgi:response regulator of citrate/malate metabolism
MEFKKLTILIVDDNRYFLKRMAAMLNELENVSHIDTADNYKDAFHILDTEEHNLVLLDIQLPGNNNGISLLKKIKQSDRDCDVIMISNCTGEFYKKQCTELGAMHVLDKTRDFEMVPGILNEISC